MGNVRRELAWGEAHESAVLKRWVKLSPHARGAKRFLRTEELDQYDFLVLDGLGVPLCFVEIKVRRTDLAKYGDVLTPWSKHTFAKKLARHQLPFLLVTQYACGSLVEVDLTGKPAVKKQVARRDRPGMKPVPHGLYQGTQLTVLAGVDDDA